MNFLSRLAFGIYKVVHDKGWDQYPVFEDIMSYRLLRRTRDRDDGVVHLKDPSDLNLSLCQSGFAADGLDMDVKNTIPPTCVFCIAGMIARLPYWGLSKDEHRQRAVNRGRIYMQRP